MFGNNDNGVQLLTFLPLWGTLLRLRIQPMKAVLAWIMYSSSRMHPRQYISIHLQYSNLDRLFRSLFSSVTVGSIIISSFYSGCGCEKAKLRPDPLQQPTHAPVRS
jgi:hypothetical protein